MSEDSVDNCFDMFQWYVALGSMWEDDSFYQAARQLYGISEDNGRSIQEGICLYFQQKVKGIEQKNSGDIYVSAKQLVNFILACADAQFHNVVSAAYEQLPEERQQFAVHHLIAEDFFVSACTRQNKILESPYTFIDPYSKRTLIETLQRSWQ